MGVAGTGSLCYTLLMTLSFGEGKPMYMLLHVGGGNSMVTITPSPSWNSQLRTSVPWDLSAI